MSDWRMSWSDEDPPRPRRTTGRLPLPPGTTRVVVVVLRGFHGIPTEPLLVAWDEERATVRLATGELRWYVDDHRQAYPQSGRIVVESHDEHPYPRGNRFMDALAVRSDEDLLETVNADEVTSVDEDGTLHAYGAPDDSRAQVVVDPASGVVLWASGTRGSSSWDLAVTSLHLLDVDHGLLDPADVTPPAFPE